MTDKRLINIANKIEARSKKRREQYLVKTSEQINKGNHKKNFSCSNIAHAFAACDVHDQREALDKKTIAIISAYNDMLSAHAPFKDYPEILKKEAKKHNALMRFAGGVPAMCDGVTQGEKGMELSLFSRDVIALSTSIALTHNVFEGAICLGICDKIVPGMLIGALNFGHIPTIFSPAGPMPSGISNEEKAETRKKYAAGEISKKELLISEQKAYHSKGTCTFYGTANTNQFIMEMMGLQLPSASFTPPATELRELLVKKSAEAVINLSDKGKNIANMINAKSWVNAMIALMVSGGSTNLTIHLIAMAFAGGYHITWEDMNEVSDIIPLLTKIYPNGAKDVNHFHNAGGVASIVKELRKEGLIFDDVSTCYDGFEDGLGLSIYEKKASITKNSEISWHDDAEISDNTIISSVQNPFAKNGGLVCLEGNIGKSIVKISAVPKEDQYIKAKARVFTSQEDVKKAFENKEFNEDVVIVVLFQGPKTNGMPELHGLTPILSLIRAKGLKVALITDGRMSGASGRILAAIHLTPEAVDSEILTSINDGDEIEIDIENRSLNYKKLSTVSKIWKKPESKDSLGTELFVSFREKVNEASKGAHIFSEKE